MSTFEVKVRRVEVVPHPDPEAHSIELAKVDEYFSVILKGSLRTGDLAVYIPEQAIVPEPLIEEMGLTGKLSGKDKNRVKAIKLRGQLSQGILYRPAAWPEDWKEGVEVSEALGIIKWIPEVPAHMSGEAAPAPSADFRAYTDIESLQRYPDMFADGQSVRIVEKLHGTNMVAGIVEGQRVVSSKGVAGRHLVLKENDNNVYWRAAKQYGLHDLLASYLDSIGQPLQTILLFGEVLGVQDLKYGLEGGKIGYCAFDLWIEGDYMSAERFDAFARLYHLPTAPILYEGPFSWAVARQYAAGQSTLAAHVREGIVVRPLPAELRTADGERMIAKLLSPAYLVRKGETTEFE
jgi:RNA ligase (TIGR02306 family)